MSIFFSVAIHNIDNPVVVRRRDGLEALVGTAQDAILIGMSEQNPNYDNKIFLKQHAVHDYQMPTTSKFYAKQIKTCDMNIANQYGFVIIR